jgi:hypothetical protein
VRRSNSFTESELTPTRGSAPNLSRHSLPRPAAAMGGGSASRPQAGRINVVDEHHDPSHSLGPPPPLGGGYHDSSGSEAYMSAGGTRNPRRSGLAGAAGLGAAAEAMAESSHQRRSSVNTPPMSIQMRMRNDGVGQHVTLRRLSLAEAAAEREAVRKQRQTQTRTRADSMSSVGGSSDERWRRVEERERAEAAQTNMSRQQSLEQPHYMPAGPLPPPPPQPPPLGPGLQPSSSPGLGDLAPPPPIAGSGMYDTGESATGSRADSNRRRRRAERAREGRGGNRVEFS